MRLSLLHVLAHPVVKLTERAAQLLSATVRKRVLWNEGPVMDVHGPLEMHVALTARGFEERVASLRDTNAPDLIAETDCSRPLHCERPSATTAPSMRCAGHSIAREAVAR